MGDIIHVGQLIREVRNKRGLSIYDLSILTGIDENDLKKMENTNEEEPPFKLVAEILLHMRYKIDVNILPLELMS